MNHNDHNSKMMWWMMAGCLGLPIILLLSFTQSIGSVSNWVWLGVVGVFVIVHVVMMLRGHGHAEQVGDEGGGTLYQCPECKLFYKGKEWADKCENWCQKHKSCNLEITKHADLNMNT